jgi:hypothetical protein
MSSRKSRTKTRRSASKKAPKETYYFSRKHVKDILTNKTESNFVNRVIIPMYLTPTMSEAIVGYYTSYNIHEMKNGKHFKTVHATITTPNGVILAHSKMYELDNERSTYLSKSIGKCVELDGEVGSGYYEKNPQAVVKVLSKFNRKLTITHGK